MHTSSSRKLTLLNPLNLHFAALALLFIVNAYLLVQLVFLWQKVRSNDARAIAQQQIALETAKVGAEPLRGLDTKLADATHDADAFYTHRLPATDSEVLTELGAITKQHNVKLTRGQYLPAPVLAGTAGELTEMRIDASLSGDYRPLVQVINALERDRMFFLINGVSLSGQQTGTVNLRLSLTTYLRGHVIGDNAQGSAQSTSGEIGPQASAAAGEVSPR
jgi:hypothetical protein